MATSTIPINGDQLFEIKRQLSLGERRSLLERLLAERFDSMLTEGNRISLRPPDVTVEQIQVEVDAERRQRREERTRETGG